MGKNKKTRVTSPLVSEVTGIPESSVRAARTGRLKDEEAVKIIGKASEFLENSLETVVGKAKRKFGVSRLSVEGKAPATKK